MPDLQTLVPDIYRVLETPEKVFDEAHVREFSHSLANRLASRLAEEKSRATLRLSNLGTKCRRKLWYSIHRPELAEPLSGPARLKFLLGDIFESVILFLARAAGHTVEDEQKEVDLHGIKGHIDARVDGVLVDVKSASPYSFRKFEQGLDSAADDFGYLTQLGGYASALGTNLGAFIAGEKVLGKLHVDIHAIPDKDWKAEVEEVKTAVEGSIPERFYSDERNTNSSRKLGLACSYCPYKRSCFPGLKVAMYGRGPVFITEGADTLEVDVFPA